MKRIIFLFLIATVVNFAQITTDAYLVQGLKSVTVTTIGRLDTTETRYTRAFSLLGYDFDAANYPLTAAVKLSGTSTATRKVSAFIQASFDGSNFANIDTISTSDSVNTLILKTALNLNGYRAPFYRLAFTGTTGNVATTFDVRIYAYRRD